MYFGKILSIILTTDNKIKNHEIWSSEIQGGLPTDFQLLIGSMVHWVPIMVMCVDIIKRHRLIVTSSLNARVRELEC